MFLRPYYSDLPYRFASWIISSIRFVNHDYTLRDLAFEQWEALASLLARYQSHWAVIPLSKSCSETPKLLSCRNEEVNSRFFQATRLWPVARVAHHVPDRHSWMAQKDERAAFLESSSQRPPTPSYLERA